MLIMEGTPPTAIMMYLAVYCFPATSTVCASMIFPRPSIVSTFARPSVPA